MTTPGRAVRIVMRQRLAARSIKIFGTEAASSFFFRRSRILRSSVRSLPNSFLPAYHFERQSLLTPTRRPIGFTFWPIQLFVGDSNFDVAVALEDRTSRAARLGSKTAHRGGSPGDGFFDDQFFRFDIVVVLRVGNGGVQDLG